MLSRLQRIVDETDAARALANNYRLLKQAPVRLGVMSTVGYGRLARFIGKVAPLTGTKQSTTEASMVQTITGATISSRAVIEVINRAIATWQPRLTALEQDGRP
jgi:hypothetical protein